MHAESPFASFEVCGRCYTLRGPFNHVWRNTQHTFMQECRCERDARLPGERAPTWVSFDYNTGADLCRGCGAEVLRSGSHLSIWFCGECRARAVERNRQDGIALVPIGRHSLMHRVGVSGPSLRSGRDIDTFVARFGTLVERIRLLDDGSHDVVRRNLIGFGLDRHPAVPLPHYLAAVADISRAGQFEAMIDWLADHARTSRCLG